jgi:hypothetical protein
MEPGLELFLFQKEGIRFASEREGALIADEMGLKFGSELKPLAVNHMQAGMTEHPLVGIDNAMPIQLYIDHNNSNLKPFV